MKPQFGGNVPASSTGSSADEKSVGGAGPKFPPNKVGGKAQGQAPSTAGGTSSTSQQVDRKGHAKRPPLPLSDDQIEAVVRCKVAVKHAFGYRPYAQASIQSYGAISLSGDKDGDKTDRIAFRIGNQVALVDPDTGNQVFLSGQSRDVKHINFSSISANGKYICVCETIRFDPTDNVDASVSIYSLSTFAKVKTLTHASTSDLTFAEFSKSDAKYLVGYIGEPEYLAVIWMWEKDKLIKAVHLTSSANKVRVSTSSLPNSVPMFTASGTGYLKFWYSGNDGNYKMQNILPHQKESEGNFIDQQWIPGSGVMLHKLVVLATIDPSAPATANSSGGVPPPPSTLNINLRQIVYIFEGVDNQTSSPQLALELKQSIFLKPVVQNQMIKSIYSAVSTYSKGFILTGSSGAVVIYERSEEKRDPYLEMKRYISDDINFISCAMLPAEDKFILMTSSGRILSVPLDASVKLASQNKDGNEEVFRPGVMKSGSTEIDTSFMTDELNSITNGYQESLASRKSSNDSSGNAINIDKFLSQIGATDLFLGGVHRESILSSDIAFDRPIMGTISSDRTLKIWNYQSLKLEISHNFKSDEPLSLAMHVSGFQVLVSFKDRVRLYNFLMDRIVMARETIQKSCKELKFSNGCQYWAGASALNIVVYDTKTFQLMCTFQGHMQIVKRLVWAPGDQVIFSAGLDGNVYGWSVSTADLRIEVVMANNRSALITSIDVDCPSTAFPVNRVQTNEDGIEIASEVEFNKFCVVSYIDSNMKVAPWSLDDKGGDSTRASTAAMHGTRDSSDPCYVVHGDTRVFITTLCFSTDRQHLIAGTSTGKLRIYPWPHTYESSLSVPPAIATVLNSGGYAGGLQFGDIYVEIHAHSTGVVSIKVAPTGDTIVSSGEDGSVFVYSLTLIKEAKKEDPKKINDTEAAEKPHFDLDFEDKEGFQFNNSVLMISAEDMEEHLQEVSLLQKLLQAIKTKAEFLYNQKEVESAEELKRILDHQEKKIIEERKRYDALKLDFDSHEKELNAQMKEKELVYIKITTELENRYEHKLATQLDRFDRLNEEMETLKQKCETLVSTERDDFQSKLNELRGEARAREKKLRSENRRIMDERIQDEDSFKVVLNQQEDEYEEELKQLIGAAESELSNERESVMKLRTLVQTKNTKLDQLKKKLIEVNNMAKSRLALLNQEKQEKNQLHLTIEHYKKNLAERETALAEKEKTILDLRSTTRTLENFRFVLDHRLQQLSVERGPITAHIESLEKHIATMYEELVDEFDQKKSVAETLQLRENKVLMQSKEITKIRYEIRLKERYIASFKRDIENIVTAMTSGKELEESVNSVYRKYIKNESVGSVTKANQEVANAVDDLLTKDPAELALKHKSSNFIDEDGSGGDGKQGQGKGGGGGGAGGGYSGRSLVQEVEETLIDSAKESDRQRLFKEREVKNLHHRLRLAKEENERKSRRAIFDNSNLLFETNEMRRQIRDLERQLSDSRELVLVATKDMKELKNQIQRYHRGDFSVSSEMFLMNQYGANGYSNKGGLDQLSNIPEKECSDLDSQSQEAFDDSILQKFNDTTKTSVVKMLLGKSAKVEEQQEEDITAINDSIISPEKPLVDPHQGKPGVKPGSPLLVFEGDRASNGNQLGHSNSDGRLLKNRNNNNNNNNNNNISQKFEFGSEGFPIVKPISTPGNEFANKHRPNVLPHEKASQKDKVIDNLSKKVETLSELLDESQREKDMQRLEITRIRKQLNQLNMSLNSSPVKSMLNGNKGSNSPTSRGIIQPLIFPGSPPGGVGSPDSFNFSDDASRDASRAGYGNGNASQEDLRNRSLAPLGKRK